MAEKLPRSSLWIVTTSRFPVAGQRRGARAARVRDLLREQILTKRYDTAMLPSEHELMLEYVTSRSQIREALDMLRDEGFIERRQGTGTIVTSSKVRHHFDRVHGIGGSLRRPPAVRSELVSVERVPAPAPVAEVLGLLPGTGCAYVDFRTHIDGVPFNTNSSYLPESMADVLSPGTFDGDFYQYLESHGVTVTAGELLVEAVNADALTAAALGVVCGAAVMLFRRVLLTTGDVPVEFGFVRCRADRLALVAKLPRLKQESIWLAS
jgi:GntR family transcriptional regulator